MGATDIARRTLAAIESGDFDTASSLISDDFTFSGPVPEPIGREEWLGLQRKLQDAFPDWSFNVTDAQEEGEVVRLSLEITGTHTGDLDLSEMGIPKVPATGNSLRLPAEHPEMIVRGDKLVAVKVNVPPGGGVPGILQQVGVELPQK
ncbi:MAG: ester cyclase [Fidelibacterota bacterium]